MTTWKRFIILYVLFVSFKSEKIMRKKLPALLLLLAFVVAPVMAQVTTNWERTGFSMPDFFGNSTERGFAYGEFDGESRILVASRAAGTNVFLLDAETGADAGTLNPEGVDGGIYAINDIGVSQDGVIFAGNLVLGASEGDPFKIYRWTDLDAEAEVVVEFGELGLRFGDRITVVGSAEDNTLAIFAPASRSNQVLVLTTEDNGDTFSHEIIELEGFTDGGIQPSAGPVGLGDEYLYYNASPWEDEAGVNPGLYSADGSHIHTFSGDWLASNTIRYFEVGDRQFVVTFDAVDGGEQRAAVFDVTGQGSTYMYHTPSLDVVPNLFLSGDLEVVVNEDDTATLYVLAANAGIASYTLEFPSVYAGDFYVGADGTAPGGADPHFASLSEAFAEFEANEPTGPITLYITSDLTEEEGAQLYGGPFTESAPLTIRPLAGTTPTVSLGVIAEEGSANEAGLAFVNSPYVTVDGSAELGGTSRDLTLRITDDAVTRAVLIHDNSPNTSILNTNIETAVAGGAMTAVRISIGDYVPLGALVENNSLGTEETSFHIGVAFSANAGQELDSHIIGNDIFASYRGITTWYVDDARFDHNRIRITGQYPISTAATAWPAGMYLVLVSNTSVAGNEIIGFETNTSAPKLTAGFLINANLGDVWIYNNMVAVPEFTNHGEAEGNEFFGVAVNNAAGAGTQYIVNNTVRIGSSTDSGTIAAFGWDKAMATTAMQWDIRNNIFVVEDDADNAYALYWPVPAGNEPEFDDNNLYVPNASIGHWRGDDFESLGEWQFGTGFDGNSVSKAVEFVSDLDLRLTGDSVGDRDLAGTPIPFVTVDIDGTERDETTPYMGAYEGSIGLPIEPMDATELANAFELHQNYPNPFNPTTTISYTLRDPGHVRIRVYNVAGQLVSDLVDSYENSGRHEVHFDARELASGMYIYRMEFDGRAESRQMMLVK